MCFDTSVSAVLFRSVSLCSTWFPCSVSTIAFAQGCVIHHTQANVHTGGGGLNSRKFNFITWTLTSNSRNIHPILFMPESEIHQNVRGKACDHLNTYSNCSQNPKWGLWPKAAALTFGARPKAAHFIFQKHEGRLCLSGHRSSYEKLLTIFTQLFKHFWGMSFY